MKNKIQTQLILESHLLDMFRKTYLLQFRGWEGVN